MTPNHYQTHHENRLRREACAQWSGQIQAALKPRPYWRNASARAIDAERSKRRGVPRQELSRGEWILQCVVLGLVVVAVAHAITGPWWP